MVKTVNGATTTPPQRLSDLPPRTSQPTAGTFIRRAPVTSDYQRITRQPTHFIASDDQDTAAPAGLLPGHVLPAHSPEVPAELTNHLLKTYANFDMTRAPQQWGDFILNRAAWVHRNGLTVNDLMQIEAYMRRSDREASCCMGGIGGIGFGVGGAVFGNALAGPLGAALGARVARGIGGAIIGGVETVVTNTVGVPNAADWKYSTVPDVEMLDPVVARQYAAQQPPPCTQLAQLNGGFLGGYGGSNLFELGANAMGEYLCGGGEVVGSFTDPCGGITMGGTGTRVIFDELTNHNAFAIAFARHDYQELLRDAHQQLNASLSQRALNTLDTVGNRLEDWVGYTVKATLPPVVTGCFDPSQAPKENASFYEQWAPPLVQKTLDLEKFPAIPFLATYTFTTGEVGDLVENLFPPGTSELATQAARHAGSSAAAAAFFSFSSPFLAPGLVRQWWNGPAPDDAEATTTIPAFGGVQQPAPPDHTNPAQLPVPMLHNMQPSEPYPDPWMQMSPPLITGAA